MPNFLLRTRCRYLTSIGGMILSNCHRLSVAVIQSCALKLMRRTLEVVQTQRGHVCAFASHMRAPFQSIHGQLVWCAVAMAHIIATQKQQRKWCLSFDLFSYQIQCVRAAHTYYFLFSSLVCSLYISYSLSLHLRTR